MLLCRSGRAEQRWLNVSMIYYLYRRTLYRKSLLAPGVDWGIPETNEQACLFSCQASLWKKQGNNLCSQSLQLSPHSTGCNLLALPAKLVTHLIYMWGRKKHHRSFYLKWQNVPYLLSDYFDGAGNIYKKQIWQVSDGLGDYQGASSWRQFLLQERTKSPDKRLEQPGTRPLWSPRNTHFQPGLGQGKNVGGKLNFGTDDSLPSTKRKDSGLSLREMSHHILFFQFCLDLNDSSCPTLNWTEIWCPAALQKPQKHPGRPHSG